MTKYKHCIDKQNETDDYFRLKVWVDGDESMVAYMKLASDEPSLIKKALPIAAQYISETYNK